MNNKASFHESLSPFSRSVYLTLMQKHMTNTHPDTGPLIDLTFGTILQGQLGMTVDHLLGFLSFQAKELIEGVSDFCKIWDKHNKANQPKPKNKPETTAPESPPEAQEAPATDQSAVQATEPIADLPHIRIIVADRRYIKLFNSKFFYDMMKNEKASIVAIPLETIAYSVNRIYGNVYSERARQKAPPAPTAAEPKPAPKEAPKEQ